MRLFLYLQRQHRLTLPAVLIILILTAVFILTPSPAHAATNCATQTQIPQIECEALVTLYYSTNGPGWVYPSDWGNKWNQDQIPCSWAGVICLDGHVEGIFLDGYKLKGSIPPQIDDLNYLEVLVLSNGQLSGISPEIGNLSNLGGLYLDHNQLNSIPSEISNLTKLYTLVLDSNQFDSFPTQVLHIPNLHQLTIAYNHLTSIPIELMYHPTLDVIDISGNPLILPEWLGSWTKLRYIGLGDFHLTTVPEWIRNLSNLQYLVLHNNHLTTVPAWVSESLHLYGLILDGNLLGGELPTAITKMTWINEVPAPYSSFVDLGWNMLDTADPEALAFLDRVDRDWKETQTLPPTEIAASAPGADGITISWTPILYTEDYGYYEVGYAPTPDGPYTVVGRTANKSANYLSIAGLSPDTTYYFAVRTFTAAHANNPNDLTSDWSASVAGTTSSYPPPLDGFKWLAPLSYDTDSTRIPAMQWAHITAATSYDLYIGRVTTVIDPVLYQQNLAAADICTGGVCTVIPADFDLTAWMYNGVYAAYLKPSNAEWIGPYVFTIDSPPPAPPTILPVTGTQTTPPAITWTLPADAASAAYFQVYIAPAVAVNSPFVYQWVARDAACGSWDSTTCTWTPDVDLPAGWAYHVYMQSWGTGGLSTGGEFGNGWAMGMFNVGGPTPALPDVNTFQYAVSGGQVTISFPDDPNTTSAVFYISNVRVSPPVVNFSQEVAKSSMACDGITCTFTPSFDVPLSAGFYNVYVQPKSGGGARGDGYSNTGWFDAGLFYAQ